MGFGRVGCDEARLTINANLHAPEMHADVKRAPVSLSAVLDKSGSMHGYLGLVKGACGFMLGQLSARDKLGVIEYDSHVEEVIALAQTKPAFKEQAQKVIDSMRAGSMTNLRGVRGPAATVCEPGTAKATPSSYPSVTSRNTVGGPGCGSASTDAFRDALYAGRGPGARRGRGGRSTLCVSLHRRAG